MTDGSSAPARRFPPPWTIDDNGACFIVRDTNGQALGYFSSRMWRPDARRGEPADARRGANIAKLPAF
jgi:hypothetical protein